MMETLAADHSIKGVLRERQVLTIPHDQFLSRHMLGFCHLNHFRCQVDACIAFLRISFLQQCKHGSGTASTVEKVIEIFLLKFRKDIGIVLFAHLIYAGIIRLVNLRCL